MPKKGEYIIFIKYKRKIKSLFMICGGNGDNGEQNAS